MTNEINNIDGRTFAVASDPANALSSVVYRTRRNDQYVLSETRGPLFDFPQLLSSSLGPHRENPILPDGNIALCYNPLVTGERILFFLDEDEGDGYIYMRTASPFAEIPTTTTVDWSFPTKLIVGGKPFEAHKRTRLAAVFHRDNDNYFVFLFCIDKNCHLVKLQGEVSIGAYPISWTATVSPYTCAPRGDLAAVELGAQLCVLYRSRELDLHLARTPNFAPATGEWPRTYPAVAWQGCSTLILPAAKLERDSALALRAHTDAGPSVAEPVVDAFYVRRDCTRVRYCSLRIVAPLSLQDDALGGTGPGVYDARPDEKEVLGGDVREGSKLGVDVQEGRVVVFYVDESNGVESLKFAEVPGGKRVVAPVTVLTSVEIEGVEEGEGEGKGKGEGGSQV